MQALVYSVIEYQSFGLEEILESLKESSKEEKTKLDDKTPSKELAWEKIKARAENFFASLEKFALKNQSFLKYSQRDRLKAQNYVGIIQTRYGTLEIFPKCFKAENLKKEKPVKIDPKRRNKFSQALKEAYRFDSEKGACGFSHFAIQESKPLDPKNLLLNFLKTLKNSPFKDSQIASLHTLSLPLLDIFIQMFVDELHALLQRGIRHDYITKEDHRFYLKGKLLFKEQIRHNAIHKERFFTASDEFIADIAENRLIKSTLLFLKDQTTYPQILASLNTLLCFFDNVAPSSDPLKEFSLLKPSRHFDYYQNTLRWCELFLQKQSFSPYDGRDEAYALLFPTEKLFESYFASMLKKHNHDLGIKEQSRGKYFLQENKSDKYALKPDLWLEKKKIIIDTKWKISTQNNSQKEEIAQSDLYQIWAYVCKYGAKEAWLVYPLCEKTKAFQEENKTKKRVFKASKSLKFCNTESENPSDENQKVHEVELKILFAPLPLL